MSQNQKEDSAHIRRVEEMFNRIARAATVTNLSEEETQKLLDQFCPNDPELRTDLKKLLLIDDESLASFMPTEKEPWKTADFEGLTITRLIGQGGMGAVLLAQQRSPKRLVAVKTLKSIFSSSEMLQRFETEANALARLQHPNIAQIYSVGNARFTSPAGLQVQQPYFVMEYVDGCRIDQFCECLNIEERLRLIAKVCEAVQFAHDQGVIHRDLKPANVLVTQSGRPKILDFGVAKFLGDDSETISRAGDFVGTLAYMSPEQLSGHSEHNDQQSDVYALGAILFEVLAGEPSKELDRRDMAAAIRSAANQPARKLGQLKPQFKGEIELIVDKCLATDRKDRYRNASEISLEIGRYLGGYPIKAKPPSTLYKTKKFIKRNKKLLMLAAGIMTILGAATLWIQNQNQITSTAKQEVEKQTSIKQKIAEILNQEVIQLANPYANNGGATVKQLAESLESTLDTQLKDDRQTERALRVNLARTFSGYGGYEAAEEQLQKALATFPEERIDSIEQANIRMLLAIELLKQWKLKEGEEILLHLNDQREVFENLSPHWQAGLFALQAKMEKCNGNLKAAESSYRQSLDLWNSIVQSDWQGELVQGVPINAVLQRANIQHNLATILFDQKRYGEAEKLYLKTISDREQVLAANHLVTCISQFGLAET